MYLDPALHAISARQVAARPMLPIFIKNVAAAELSDVVAPGINRNVVAAAHAQGLVSRLPTKANQYDIRIRCRVAVSVPDAAHDGNVQLVTEALAEKLRREQVLADGRAVRR